MIVATWNVNSLKMRMPRVTEWLKNVEPDVVCLQETKMADDAFPALTFRELGYEAIHNGEGRWNGVAILSKVGLSNPSYGFGEGVETDPQARLIAADCGGVRVHSVYVPNGRSIEDDHFQYKLNWLKNLLNLLDSSCKPSDDVIIAGDWNIAPEDIDVWDRSFFEGMTHVTPEERNALEKIKAWGLLDTFRNRYKDEIGLYSYYDYQAGRFHKRQGMRIDYVLSSQSLAEKSSLDLVDRNARKGTKPSDHAPVIAIYK